MNGQQHILDDKITLKEVILNFRGWITFFLGQWKFFLLVAIIGMVLGALVSIFKKPVYHAETTFVLEESDMGGMGQVSGLASLIGINLGSMSGPSGIFQGENIMELYKSDNMLGKTLLSPFDDKTLLIDRFIGFNELDKKWESKVDLASLKFSIPRENFSVTQDSVVKEISKLIREKHLSVEKPNRKLSIIYVTVSSKDELFSKVFNESMVENVNTFYFETKTKKTAENLTILQMQADSVRAVLDENLMEFANIADRIPFPNALVQSATVNSRRKQVDIQAASAVFAEITKNLEIAKVNHRNNSPLIQIIDSPRYPLKITKIKLLKGIVFGAFLMVFVAMVFLYFRQLYRLHIEAS